MILASAGAALLGLLAVPGSPALRVAGPRPAHPGQPVWLDLWIEADGVVLEVQGEPEPLRRCLELETELLGPMDAEAHASLCRELEAYFAEHNPLRIDGERIRPTLASLELPEDSEDEDGWLVVHLKLAYPSGSPPRRVGLVWEHFEGAEWMGETFIPVLIQEGRRPEMAGLYPEEPEYQWHRTTAPEARSAPQPIGTVSGDPRPLTRLPAVSLGLLAAALVALVILVALGTGAGGSLLPKRRRFAAWTALACTLGSALLWTRPQPRLELPWHRGVALPAPDQALDLFETLHRNIYAAFDARTEDEIYDLLAVSVSPTLLDTLYVEIYESLILREEGGAVCRVEEVEILERNLDLHPGEREADGESEDRPIRPERFDVDCTWRVHGLVSHWGHVHRRVNHYRATYRVEHDGASWKLAAIDVLEANRRAQA